MSDDIFIKHPAAFQQPYIARASKNAQEPVIAQRDARTPAIYQIPSTYNLRSPSTYQNPVSTQNPFIRNQQEPNIRAQQEPNIRAQQIPFTYQHRSPLTYNHRSPSSYQHRSPSIYQVSYQARQPSQYQHRSPGTYQSPVAYRHPIIYQHRSPSSYQATGRNPVIYQHQSPSTYSHRSPSIANAQNPFIRSAQTPFTYNFRSPSIGSYQTTYSHQQPTSGFQTVVIQEYVARASELITGFGADVDIANDINYTGSGSTGQMGASSIVINDDEVGSYPSGGSGSATASAKLQFKVAPISSGSNDYGIYVKKGFSNNDAYIGNMSSSSSSSFAYGSALGSSSYNLLYRLNNIGNGRVQCKLNFPTVTSAPYSFNVGSSSPGWHGSNINSPGGYYSGDNLQQEGMTCAPLTWPRTTNGTHLTSPANGNSVEFFVMDGNDDDTDNNLTTSYQNVPSGGLGVTFQYAQTNTDSAGVVNYGISTIYEFVVKDLDGGAEYTCDLLVVYPVTSELSEESGGE